MSEQLKHSQPHGIVSIGDHYTEANVHVVSSVAALDTFWTVPGSEKVERIVHIPTAADRFIEFGYDDYFVQNERNWLKDQMGRGALMAVQELSLRSSSLKEVRDTLISADAVLVGGGNSQYLMEMMRETEADKLIEELVRDRSIFYLGRSAGAIVAGPEIGLRGSLWPALSHADFDDPTALGITDVYPIPHIDSIPIMDRLHHETGQSGWQVVAEMALRHPLVYLTDAVDLSLEDPV